MMPAAPSEREFLALLEDTKVWCHLALRASPAGGTLRTGALRLTPWRDALPDMTASEYLAVMRERARQIGELVLRRRELLLQAAVGEAREGHDSEDGRFLLWTPGDSLLDGAAQEASGGVLDELDGPPWDTWIGCFQPEDGVLMRCWTEALGVSTEAIVAWIPDALVPAVERGIRQCLGGCLLLFPAASSPLAVYQYTRALVVPLS
jgi:hypothetical protein